MSGMNRQWLLRSRPVGMVQESDFELKETPVPAPGEGQALVRNTYLAFEPAMRGWIEDRPSYMPPVGIGEVMRGMTVGEVVESNFEGLAPGLYTLLHFSGRGLQGLPLEIRVQAGEKEIIRNPGGD